MSIIHFNTELFMKVFKEYRGEKSQSDIAKELNLGRSMISLLENGKQVPTLETLKNICEKINKDVSTFFIKEEEDPILLLMGRLKETDRNNLHEVLERISIREHYIAINNRCEE
jgi:transcriptional regulator with XRE-family HTH domain